STGFEDRADPLSPDVGPSPGPGALTASELEGKGTIADLVHQNFATWKPGENEADKASPGRLALSWLEQPDSEAEFSPLGQAWTPGKLVSALSLSPSGEFLLAGRFNGQCRVWSLKTGQQTGFLTEKLPSMITAAAISPDGKFAAMACGPEGLAIWNTATGKIVSKHATGELLALTFSPDSQRVTGIAASAWHDVAVSPDAKIASLAFPKPVNFAALSPGGKRALIFRRDGKQVQVFARDEKDNSRLIATDHGTLPMGPSAMVIDERFWAISIEGSVHLQQLKSETGDVLFADIRPAIKNPDKLLLVA